MKVIHIGQDTKQVEIWEHVVLGHDTKLVKFRQKYKTKCVLLGQDTKQVLFKPGYKINEIKHVIPLFSKRMSSTVFVLVKRKTTVPLSE